MAAPYRDSHFRRLVDVVLPGGGAVIMMFEGYFDESGDLEVSPKIFCISGYCIESDQAKVMDEKWGEVLVENNIPYFHMVDCAHGNPPFDHLLKSERVDLVKKLIELIKAHTLCGFSILAKGEYFEASEKHPDEYSSCVSSSIVALNSFLTVNRISGQQIAYFFENGHKNRGRAYNHVAAKLLELNAPLTFASKQQVKLLQAADLLAWQSTKYAKDRTSGARPARKDFLSLME